MTHQPNTGSVSAVPTLQTAGSSSQVTKTKTKSKSPQPAANCRPQNNPHRFINNNAAAFFGKKNPKVVSFAACLRTTDSRLSFRSAFFLQHRPTPTSKRFATPRLQASRPDRFLFLFFFLFFFFFFFFLFFFGGGGGIDMGLVWSSDAKNKRTRKKRCFAGRFFASVLINEKKNRIWV